MTKHELRKLVRSLKNEISAREIIIRSEKIFSKVEQSDFFRDADCILLYWAMGDEVQTRDFIMKWWNKKRIILPSVNGNELLLKEFKGEGDLVDGEFFQIPEPQGPEFLAPEKINLIIVPGVAFDRNNNRMGRGRGYYDKFLATIRAKKVGVCWDFQLFDQVPTDPHDVKMDHVVSDG